MTEATRVGPIGALGHLAAWAGLYVAGAVAAAGALAGIRVGAAALLGALCVGAGVYQLDRVKLADACIDEADHAAHPRRAAFLFRKRRVVRTAASLLIVAGTASLSVHHPVAALLGPAAAAGVVVYAGLPRRFYAALHAPRPKDVFIVKNMIVAGSITLFAAAVLFPATRGDWAGLALGVVGVVPHVFADAVLCDLDDLAADSRFGTATIPVRAGVARARALAWVVCIAMPLAGALVPVGERRGAWVAFHGLMLGTLGGLDLARPHRVRDLIDLRLPLCAALVLIV